MFNRIIKPSIPAIVALVLFGCGKQHKAESVVKEFMAQYMTVDDYSIDFLKIDSTTHVTDSLINRMKFTAAQNKLFKKGIKYGRNPKSGRYVYLPVRIYIGKDTISQTFYLDTNTSNVIAFK